MNLREKGLYISVLVYLSLVYACYSNNITDCWTTVLVEHSGNKHFGRDTIIDDMTTKTSKLAIRISHQTIQ